MPLVDEARALRRSGRIQKEIAIFLTGCDGDGKQFIEETKTVVLSRRGAGIVSTHKLSIEQELVLVDAESNRETEIRIVGQLGSANGSYTYGVAFLDPDLNFWNAEFPPETCPEGSADSMPFQCTICGRREVIGLEALELDIYAVQGMILRDCKHCKNSTLWTRASTDVPDATTRPEVTPFSPVPTPPPGAHPAPPSKNRRKHPRIKVSFTACVRSPGFEDDVVQCQNVSRGGLCFKSSHRYQESARIEVAAPFSAGGSCILVPAQIVHVHELPQEAMYLCGVRYLGFKKDPLVP